MANDHDILLAIERTKARVKMADTVTGLLWLLAALAAFLLTVVVVDQASPLGRTARLSLLAALGVVAAAGLAVVLLLPTWRRVNSLYAARLIERQADDLFRNSLVSYLELRDDPGVDPAIRDAVATKASRDLRSVDLEAMVDRRPMRLAGVALAAVIVLVILFAAMTPKSFAVSLGRALGGEATAPTATRIVAVRPESPASVVAGESLAIEAVLDGTLPEAATVLMTADGKYWDAVPMRRVERGRWQLTVEAVERDLKFTVEAGDARSDEHVVQVIPRPTVTQVRTRLAFPDYTLRREAAQDGGNVAAVVGTRVHLAAQITGTPTEPPELVWGSGNRATPLEPGSEPGQWQGEFTVTADDTYTVHYRDRPTGRENAAAVRYRVQALGDRPPTVDLVSPSGTVTVPAGGSVTMSLRAADDYGLGELALVWRKADGAAKTVTLKTYPRDRAVLRDADAVVLRVKGDLSLAEGDEAWLRFVVADRLPARAQEGRSEELHIVIGKPDSQSSGSQSSGQDDPSSGGAKPKDGSKPKDGPNADGNSGGDRGDQGDTLSSPDRDKLEQMRRELEKLQQALKQAESRGTGEASGTGKEPSGQKPPESPNGQNNDGDGERTTSGGPAENADPTNRQRNPDAKVGPRAERFTESGLFTGGPTTDRQLAQTVGAALRTLDREVREKTIDPKLLQDLGWTAASVQQFVSQYEDRFGKFAAQGAGGAATTSSGTGEVKTASGGMGTVGSGAASAKGTSSDNVQSLQDSARRADSPYARIIDAYTRSVGRE